MQHYGNNKNYIQLTKHATALERVKDLRIYNTMKQSVWNATWHNNHFILIIMLS